MRLLVNASNLHTGGGAVVAASFIADLAQSYRNASGTTVVASRLVDTNLRSLGSDTSVFKSYVVFDQLGIKALWHKYPVRWRDFDVVFTVFGPRYSIFKPKYSVTGFAQPWIVYPKNDLIVGKPRIYKILLSFKFLIQKMFFSRDDLLVVEHEFIRETLKRQKMFRDRQIAIVSNEVDDVFFDRSRWVNVDLGIEDSKRRVGVVARNYPHKNLDRLPEVKKILESEFDLCVEFWVTFSLGEWNAVSAHFRSSIRNAGQLSIGQVPSFMSQMDAMLFPSLLECYSAVPIEAQALGIPLVASDREFIRGTAKDYPIYVNPLDSRSIARGIKHALMSFNSHGCVTESAAPPVDETRRRADAYMKLLLR